MGWLFIILGLVLVGIGGFLGIYGQQLISQEKTTKPEFIERHSETKPVLSPQQDKLLNLIFSYQQDLASTKLIISRDGSVRLDETIEEIRGNLVKDLFGIEDKGGTNVAEFITLMEELPPDYLRTYAESKLDSPFVVTVTQEGIRYLRSRP